MTNHPKLVTSLHYHIWTDALHARALAHQAQNKWDRGTYVRWCITTAWTVLEIACQDATGDSNISYSFQKNLDAAIASKSLPPLQWGSGLWQQVKALQKTRKGYVHRFVSETKLFPVAEVTDRVIVVVRNAIVDIYAHVSRVVPPWIQDDDDRGWDKGPAAVTANPTVIRAGAGPDDEKVIRVCFVQDAQERPSEVLPPGTDPQRYVDDIIQNVCVPISEVRVYEGKQLISSKAIPMRGA